MPGQIDDRSGRVKQTADWLQATPQTLTGETLEMDGEPNYTEIAEHTTLVEFGLLSGLSQVIVTEHHEPTRKVLRTSLQSRFSEEELAKIIFDPE